MGDDRLPDSFEWPCSRNQFRSRFRAEKMYFVTLLPMLSSLEWHTAVSSQFYSNFRKLSFEMTSVRLLPIYFFIYCKFNLFTSLHAFKAPFLSIIFHHKRPQNGPSNYPSLTSDPMPFPWHRSDISPTCRLKGTIAGENQLRKKWRTEEWNFSRLSSIIVNQKR